MPLRDDLLQPISGDNPSGPNLKYDPIFDEITEARREEDDSEPVGDWKRAVKKADYPKVVRLAGQTLASRTKDLRLAAFLIESTFKLEGALVLPSVITFLRQLQEGFWETLHPEIEDGDLELRVIEVERVARSLVPMLKNLPLTRSGRTPAEYDESRIVGYDDENASDEKKSAREAAIQAGKLSAEEFDKDARATPKAFYSGASTALSDALEQLEKLDLFQRDAYGEQYPQVSGLRSEIQQAAGYIDKLLTERRAIEPDVATTLKNLDQLQAASLVDSAPAPAEPDWENTAAIAPAPAPAVPAAASATSRSSPASAPAPLSQASDAYAQIVRAAEFLFDADAQSPVPYLVCAGLRLGETLQQGDSPEGGFAIGPSSTVRQSLRGLLVDGSWNELLRACLPVLADPCARAWLDVHRYVWRAAEGSGSAGLMAAVCSTVRGALGHRPELRHWTLEDDTAAANPDTQQWLNSEVLPRAEVPAAVEEPQPAVAALPPEPDTMPYDEAEEIEETVYERAVALLQGGDVAAAIDLVERDARTQPTGRLRFRRRMQLARLCVSAGKVQLGRTILEDLAREVERRELASWESGEMLAAPLTLLLKCLEGHPDGDSTREQLFARLCLVDAKSAVAVEI